MNTAITSATQPSRTASSTDTATARRDRVARVILGLCAVGALIATAATAAEVADADGTLQVAETWRLAGLPVFAGLFVILATGLRRVAGLWELVIVNKLALAAAGATYLSDADGGNDLVYVDGALVVLLMVAYTLAQGWSAWSER